MHKKQAPATPNDLPQDGRPYPPHHPSSSFLRLEPTRDINKNRSRPRLATVKIFFFFSLSPLGPRKIESRTPEKAVQVRLRAGREGRSWRVGGLGKESKRGGPYVGEFCDADRAVLVTVECGECRFQIAREIGALCTLELLHDSLTVRQVGLACRRDTEDSRAAFSGEHGARARCQPGVWKAGDLQGPSRGGTGRFTATSNTGPGPVRRVRLKEYQGAGTAEGTV